MDRSVFKRHFVEAAAAARDFARQFIEEPLPDGMRFRVQLNMSHDRNAAPEFKRFPEDSSDARALDLKGIDVEEVIDVLWRDGYVPQWVDLMVVGETGDASVLDVVACGRFIDDEQRLYYADTGIAPFSPKGPWLPVNYVQGDRFSIYTRSCCWSVDDLERARRHAEKVWSLELHGPEFNDRTLAGALTFPRLEVLELFGVRLTGPGLTALEDLPRLRHLRARFGETAELQLAELPVLEGLETLAMSFLPPQVVSMARLVEATPDLKDLTLASTSRTRADGELAFRRLEHLTIEFPTIPAWVRMPTSLRWLSLDTPEATDDDVRRTLATCPETLESLGLRGTPVSDSVLEELERFPALNYVDAVETRMTNAALSRLAERRPGFKCWPRLDSSLNTAR